jgi:hypothetical protein
MHPIVTQMWVPYGRAPFGSMSAGQPCPPVNSVHLTILSTEQTPFAGQSWPPGQCTPDRLVRWPGSSGGLFGGLIWPQTQSSTEQVCPTVPESTIRIPTPPTHPLSRSREFPSKGTSRNPHKQAPRMLTAWVGTHPPPTLRQQVHLLTKSTVVKFILDRPDQNKDWD